MSDCFWILTNGKLVTPDSLHILAVVSAPELFGESEDKIEQTFQRYGQNSKSNIESKAREEILLRIIKRNHIRIRKYVHKRCQHWSIQLYRLTDERISSISAWAKSVVTDGDMYADVLIHQLYDDSKIQTSLNLLVDGIISSDVP